MVRAIRQTEIDEMNEPSVFDPAAGRALFDRQARRLLGISGEQFLRNWDTGEYRQMGDSPDANKVVHLAILIPFARPDS